MRETNGPELLPDDGRRPPLVLLEDDHLLAIAKPAGVNTHRPGPGASDGLYEWLRSHGGPWARLSLPHRLDRPTSGVIVFGKSRLANGSLTRQFARHEVLKVYEFLTARDGPAHPVKATAPLYEPGARSRGGGRPKEARTRFATLSTRGGLTLVEARPVTGRTHQIRKHAWILGWPVLGDRVHGPSPEEAADGGPWPHLMLHARELTLAHPEDRRPITIEAPRPRAFEAVWNGERNPAVLAELARLDREVLSGPVSVPGPA